MDFGLTQEQINHLIAIFKKYLKSGKVIIYGSRAKGNFTSRSDIDLVIKNSKTIDMQLLANLKEEIQESDLPYLVDIQFFETIKNVELIEHIIRVGKVLYQKDIDKK